MKKTIITIMLFSFFNTAHAKCESICASDVISSTTISGLYYILGRNSAEAAGTFQFLTFALPLTKSNDITAEQYSYAALSVYNFTVLSKYNTDDHKNIKAAEFNAAAMLLLGLYSSYRSNTDKSNTNSNYNFNINLTPDNNFQLTMTYNF